MLKRLVAGNWKMHKTISEAKVLANRFVEIMGTHTDAEVVLAPPFPALNVVGKAIANTPYHLAAQNTFWEDEGAYTGEISPLMLKDAGCRFVIVGHSERRILLAETNDMVNKKIRAVLRHGMHPILCVGESLAERERGRAQAVVEEQILQSLAGLDAKALQQVTIAYEPVWAIGTGRAATISQIEDMHEYVRQIVGKHFRVEKTNMRILYGGSVSGKNAAELFASRQIGGALVGKACLDPETFANICRLAVPVPS